MRKPIVLTPLALLAMLGFVPQALAVELTVEPVIRTLQNLDSTSFDENLITLYDSTGRVGVAEGSPPMIVTVDYYMSIAGLAGAPFEVGFGNAAFDLLPQNLAVADGTPGWNPDVTQFDINGDLPEGLTSLWSDNGDYGPSGTDLVSIIVGIAPGSFGPPEFDPRRTLGQQTPTLLGTSLFTWDPASSASAALDIDLEAFSTYGSDMRLRRRASGVPHSGSLAMEVSAGQAGDTDKDGDVDLTDLNNVRNHFEATGEHVLGDTSPYDGVVNLDDLNRVRENFGEALGQSGDLTAVPEPNALALAACALLAAMVWRQRRLDA